MTRLTPDDPFGKHRYRRAGVVYAFAYPNDGGDLLCWAEGCGPLQRNGHPVVTRIGAGSPDASSLVAVSYHAADKPAANAKAVAPARFLAMPSIAYRLALAAAGDVVAAVSTGHPQAWDFAAGHALLIGAGGTLVDGAGREVAYDRQGRTVVNSVFGGAHAVVEVLARRDWSTVMRDASRCGRVRYPLTRTRDSAALDRAQGCLLGQFAGDALGALVELKDKAAIARLYPQGLHDLADGGPHDIIAGQPTDDSEMALALARTIARRRGYDVKAVFDAYRAWLGSHPFDVGGTTRTALNTPFSSAGTRTRDSQANGSLMRVAPIGILTAGNPAEAAGHAARDSALTHPHPVCLASCRAYTAAIAVGLAQGDRSAMLQSALDHAGDDAGADAVRATIEAARTRPPHDYQHQMGWVLIALQNAFHHLASGTQLAAAITVTAMQGGDTDTNAAIVGALLGAADGFAGVPASWRASLLTCRPIQKHASQPRPAEYWPDDALDLAEALLCCAPNN